MRAYVAIRKGEKEKVKKEKQIESHWIRNSIHTLGQILNAKAAQHQESMPQTLLLTHSCLRWAAALTGLGLELWKESETHQH
jgi:hypothetical protein